jgi:diacylglycerol kinase (ATP)
MSPRLHQDPPSGGSTVRRRSRHKSRGGLARLAAAMRYSVAGLRAAIRHEAAFRQELALGIPLLLATPWLAPGRWQAVAMVASVLFVFVVELLNSAIEAVADAVTADDDPMLGRAKDLGSAAVMVSLVTAVAVWTLALWP